MLSELCIVRLVPEYSESLQQNRKHCIGLSIDLLVLSRE